MVMKKTIEQRAAICFCWKTGVNVTKTFKMIQKVYGESAVHRATSVSLIQPVFRRVRVDS